MPSISRKIDITRTAFFKLARMASRCKPISPNTVLLHLLNSLLTKDQLRALYTASES